MTSFTSLKDLGYQQAKTGDSLNSQAEYAIEKISGFPNEISPESRAELYEGYRMRYSENHPATTYAVIDGHYVLATDEHTKNKKIEKIEVGVAYAFAYSSQEFGKLANTNPALHGLVKKWRDDVADYCSNRLGDLKSKAKKILNKGQASSRTTLDFVQSMTKAFEAQEKSVKVKHAKGDATADPAKFKTAVTAFWKTYK
jgi:uncharacterized membrane protein